MHARAVSNLVSINLLLFTCKFWHIRYITKIFGKICMIPLAVILRHVMTEPKEREPKEREPKQKRDPKERHPREMMH